MPICELRELRGLKPSWVNARHVKTVPGRKRDWNDAQWLQKLHTLGLLKSSFRPAAEMWGLRTLLRHRAQLIAHRAPHILPMQQARKRMHLPLREVLTEIPGVTGQAILRASVGSERDPLQLAQVRNPACTSSTDQIAKALTGTWRDELLCILKPAVEVYDDYTAQRRACDAQLERQCAALKPRCESDDPPPPMSPVKPGSKSKQQPAYHGRAHLMRLTGVDLVAVTGIAASLAQTILSELGTERSRFPTVKHFCAWLGLAPHHDISGGRVLRSRTLKVVNRATPAFRQAAQSVARSPSAFGASFRLMRARLGPEQAPMATAHKIARVVYHLLQHREAFQGKSAMESEWERREREPKHLNRRAKPLGYTLIPVGASQPAPAP